MLCKYSPCSHCFSVCLTDSAIRKLSGKVNHPEGQSHNHSQGQQHLFSKPGDISVCPQCLSVRKAKKHLRDQLMNIVEGKQIVGNNKGKYYLNLNSVEAI